MSLVLMSSITVLLYVYLKEKRINRIIAWGSAFLFATLSIHHENIFWISGQSSLLSALFFISALVVYQRVWNKTAASVVSKGIGVVCIFLSMLCYDGMVVLPVIFVLLSASLYKKGKEMWPILLLMPLYWGIRTYAGAVAPSGDYGYKWTTFFVNSFGNAVSYAGGVVIGPCMLEYTSSVRMVLKQFLPQVTLGVGILVAGCVALGIRMRTKIGEYQDVLVFVLCGVVSSASYLGLGNASERYAFIPSIFIIIVFATVFSHLWKKYSGVLCGALFIGIVLVFSWWNIGQVQRLEGDWKRASDIVQTSLLAIKEEAYPPKYEVTFFFVNPPIRYGRAWIFPTGLTDALWHTFRDNLSSVSIVPSIKAAYDFPIYKGTRYVYVFEDYVLKKGFMKTIEVPSEK